MNVLCVCRYGVNRSRCIADYMRGKGHEAMYAGAEPGAINSATQDMVDWADVIIVARSPHADLLKARLDVRKRIISLNVRNGSYDDPHLREEVEDQLRAHLPLTSK